MGVDSPGELGQNTQGMKTKQGGSQCSRRESPEDEDWSTLGLGDRKAPPAHFA